MINMRRAYYCVWGIFIVLLIFGTLIMKNYVEDLEKELTQINSRINEDIKSIHILKADWNYLNSPEKLRSLASKHIALEPVKAEQIIDYSVLPFEYEKGLSSRQIAARRSISNRANENRQLRHLAKLQR